MKKFWIRKGLMFLFIFVGATVFFSGVVMLLWNQILPFVIGVKAISFMQAMGILILSKILFGGFGGRHHRGGPNWREKMKNGWANMSPQEREKFKAEWKNRCGGRWGMQPQPDETANVSAE